MSHANGSPASSSGSERPLAVSAGFVLMATSFLVYLVYGMLPFLGLDAAELAGAAVAASLASWGLFSLGVALAGRNAIPHFRRALASVWRRLGGGRKR